LSRILSSSVGVCLASPSPFAAHGFCYRGHKQHHILGLEGPCDFTFSVTLAQEI
jgi:hypothetical protein